MATFGEMTAIASEHLTDLQDQLHTQRLARDLRSRTTTPELARLAHVLARYYDRIADGFGVPLPATTGVRDAAHRAGALIKQAESLLGPPADTEAPKSVLTQKLRATSIALGCGLDLLASHFPTAPDRASSANAAVITTLDATRSLLYELSAHTATVGHLAHRTSPPGDRAGPLLLKAAVLTRFYSQKQTPPPIAAIPVHHIPDRIPPTIGEDRQQALAGINASIQRLSNPTQHTSVTTWRYLARAATITCDLNLKTFQQLIYRMKELNEPGHRAALKDAAIATRRTGGKWRQIVARWDEEANHYGHPANGPATDASDLILRLGRLIHADPSWTPGPRSSYRMKAPERLAPNLAQAAHVATVTLKTIEACNTLAANHRAAINDAAVLGILRKQREHPTHMPRVPWSVHQLSKAYEAAEAKGLETMTSISRAIQVLNPNSHNAEEAHLIIRRATTTHDRRAHGRLAAAEFPIPITDCLQFSRTTSQPTPGGRTILEVASKPPTP